MPERIRLIRHEVNGGVGKAIVTGYKAAVEEKIDMTAVMAGDAQMDPDDLPALLDPVAAGEVDYSQGQPAVHRRRVEDHPARTATSGTPRSRS